MRRTALQIKAEIKVLQAELANMGDEVDWERLEDFHSFCEDHFGRRLVIGDVLEKNIMVYPKGEKAHKSKLSVKVVKPISRLKEANDGLVHMFCGYPNIDIKYLTSDEYDGRKKGCRNTITKSVVRTFKLVK